MSSPFQPVLHCLPLVLGPQILCHWWVPCKNNHFLQLSFFREIF